MVTRSGPDLLVASDGRREEHQLFVCDHGPLRVHCRQDTECLDGGNSTYTYYALIVGNVALFVHGHVKTHANNHAFVSEIDILDLSSIDMVLVRLVLPCVLLCVRLRDLYLLKDLKQQ